MKADKKQIHRVELVVQLDDTDVGEWVDGIYEMTNNVVVDVTSNPIRVIASDTYPLDIEQPENKWIKDILDVS
jgi:hypothetical protein